MTAFQIIDNVTNKVLIIEQCLGNAMESLLARQETGSDVRVEEISVEEAG